MALSPKYRNWLRTLGAPEDPVATDTTSEWSLVSLVKALYQKISDGSFAAAVTGRAESLVSLCQGAAAQVAALTKLSRSYKESAEASAASASTSGTNAAASESNAGGYAATAQDALNFIAGTAMFGQRAKRDRVAAQAAKTAAEAAAASITAEGLVLGVQVYS
jgi:hypothetical protein